jgi:hypothetical protein
MELIKTIELPNNRRLKIYQDSDPFSPRENDNLSKMIFLGKYSHLGDEHDFHETHESFEEHQKYIEKQLDVAYITPVYAYIHGGMTISTTPFSCRFDSGKLGWVVVTKDDIKKYFGIKNVTKKYIERAIEIAHNEIKELDYYIRGDIYGFQIVKVEICNKGCEHEELEDSVFGFYGDNPKTNGMIDYLSEEDAKFIMEKT